MPRRPLAVLLLVLLGSMLRASRAEAYVYWVNGTGASTTIARGNNDGSALNASFIPVPSGTKYIAISSTSIFWAGADGNIGRANIGGSSVNPALITGQGSVYGLATAGSRVYWAAAHNV